MATHFRILAWRIPWTEDPGRLQSVGSQSRIQLSDYLYRYLPGLRGMSTTGPSLNSKLWGTGTTLFLYLPPLNRDRAKTAWMILFQSQIPQNGTDMTQQAGIQEPRDWVFSVDGDSESPANSTLGTRWVRCHELGEEEAWIMRNENTQLTPSVTVHRTGKERT